MTEKFCTSQELEGLASVVPFLIVGRLGARAAFFASAVLSSLLFLMAVIGTVARFMIRDKNYFFQKVEGYWTPNAPLLGSIMVAIYGLLSLATACVAHARLDLNPKVSLAELLHLAIMVPTPLFIWAWIHAMGAAYSFHTLSHERRPRAHAYQMSPRALNTLFVAVPAVVIILNVITLPVLSATSAHRMQVSASRIVEKHGYGAPVTVWTGAIKACHEADGIYRSIWATWSVIFLLVVSIYVTYSRLLYQDLHVQLHYLDIIPVDVTERMAKKKETNCTLRIVKKNIYLGKWEMVAFTLYCSPWAVIGLYKALRGFDMFIKVKLWATMLCLELYLAFLSTGATIGIIIWRSLIIYRAQRHARRQLAQRVTGLSLHVFVETDFHVEEGAQDDDLVYLAFERGRNGSYSDYHDIAQLAAPQPIKVQRSSSTKLVDDVAIQGSPPLDDSHDNWVAPEDWESNLRPPMTKEINHQTNSPRTSIRPLLTRTLDTDDTSTSTGSTGY